MANYAYTAARKKAMADKRRAANPARRMRMVRESGWTTDELVAQSLAEGVFSAKWLARVRERITDEAELRTWVAWQLSDARIVMGKPDPEEPAVAAAPGHTPGMRGTLDK